MTNTKDWKVMPSKCPTCPFGENGHLPTRDMVTERCLTSGSQICHHPAIHGKKQTHLCRGARDVQLQCFAAVGFIEFPTDEAWDKKRQELGV